MESAAFKTSVLIFRYIECLEYLHNKEFTINIGLEWFPRRKRQQIFPLNLQFFVGD